MSVAATVLLLTGICGAVLVCALLLEHHLWGKR